MTTNNSQSPPTTRNERRGSLSSFESLLRLDDTKGIADSRQPGTGAAVLYLRVSTQRQMLTAIDLDPDGNSIATQREATIKRAKRLKAPIVKEFVEPGHSAQSIAKRPIFRELLHFVEDNPDIDYVIIYMRSRVFRNQTDAAITKRILDSMGVRLISAKEEFGEGYMADAMEAITDIMNEVQVRQSGEDISNKMLHKAKNGGTVGRAKVGYLNVRKDVEGHLVNSIDVDPKRAPHVTWAFEQYATGDYSLTRLQTELEMQGLTTRKTMRWEEKIISRSKLGTILRDPYYLGMVTYKGQLFPGKHPPLVTAEVFEQVQRILDVRAQRNQRDIVHNHFLRAMMRCGRCSEHGRDRQMLFSRANNPRSGVHDYFLCSGRQDKTCDLPYLPTTLVESAIQREVDSLRLSPDELLSLRDQVKQQVDRQLSTERSVRDRTKKELVQLEVKEDRLLDLAADGAMDVEKIRERLARIRVQKVRLEERLSSTDEVVRRESQSLLDYLTLLENPGVFYATADDNVKRKLLRAFFSCIWINDEDHEIIVESVVREPVDHIWKTAQSVRNSKGGTEQTLSASDSLNPTLLSLGDGSSKFNLVHTVDTTSSKYRHLPPTVFQLARLAKNSHGNKPEAEPGVDGGFIVRNLRRRLGPKVISELVSKYNAGAHTPALAKEYEISATGLWQLLHQEGVKFRGQSITPADSDRAVKLYESGLTIREVVTEIGYSLGTIRRELHRRGVPMRPSGRWNHLPPKLPSEKNPEI